MLSRGLSTDEVREALKIRTPPATHLGNLLRQDPGREPERACLPLVSAAPRLQARRDCGKAGVMDVGWPGFWRSCRSSAQAPSATCGHFALNLHVLAVLCVFDVAPFLPSWSELALRLTAAALAFAAGFVLFALRMLGGGDVKMMAAVFLLVPASDNLLFLQFRLRF